jgi:tetratricopeptide (TPR) repeat protein
MKRPSLFQKHLLGALISVGIGTAIHATASPVGAPIKPAARPIDELIAAAEEVLEHAKRDVVSAAKDAPVVFLAANALVNLKRHDRADEYFVKGLQLNPWALDEQMHRAHLLEQLDRSKEAEEIAAMVLDRTETDSLANDALHILGRPEVSRPSSPPVEAAVGPWICIAKLGAVDSIVLNDVIEKLRGVLGLPVYCIDGDLGLPPHHRSSFDHWIQRDISPSINWE